MGLLQVLRWNDPLTREITHVENNLTFSVNLQLLQTLSKNGGGAGSQFISENLLFINKLPYSKMNFVQSDPPFMAVRKKKG